MSTRAPPLRGPGRRSQARGHLHVLQLNMRRSTTGADLLRQFLTTQSVDVLLIQDPPLALRHGESFPGYDLFLPHQQLGTSPSQFEEPLTTILLRTTLSARSIDFAHPRVCGVVVSTQRGPLALFSAYFQPTSGAGLMELSSILTRVRQQFPLILLGADCNGHSPWWGPPDTASSPL